MTSLRDQTYNSKEPCGKRRGDCEGVAGETRTVKRFRTLTMGMRLSARFAAIGVFRFFFDYERGEAEVSYGGWQRPLNLT